MTDYILVPVEPTEEMLEAGHYAVVDGCHPSGIYADMLAAAPSAHGPLSLSDEKILEIASNPMSTPCSPWWLKGDVKAGDVQNAAIAFAKAVLKAATPVMQGEPVGWHTEDHLDDKSATTYNAEVAQRWRAKGWPVTPLYTAPQPAEQQPAPAVQVEPVAWMHSDPGRVDVIHDKVRKLLKDSSDNAGYLHRPLDKSERYTIPLYTASQPAEQHPDDAAVDRFAAAMKAKLAKKRQEGRGGWQSMTAGQLSALLHEHVPKKKRKRCSKPSLM